MPKSKRSEEYLNILGQYINPYKRVGHDWGNEEEILKQFQKMLKHRLQKAHVQFLQEKWKQIGFIKFLGSVNILGFINERQ